MRDLHQHIYNATEINRHLKVMFEHDLSIYTIAVIEALEAVSKCDGALMITLPTVPATTPIPPSAERIDGEWMIDADTLVAITLTGKWVQTCRQCIAETYKLV